MDSDDQYGLATHSDFSLVLLTSAGEQLISKNENNVREFKELPEKVYDISKKVHDQFFDLNYVYQAYLTKSGVETSGIVPHFMEGNSSARFSVTVRLCAIWTTTSGLSPHQSMMKRRKAIIPLSHAPHRL